MQNVIATTSSAISDACPPVTVERIACDSDNCYIVRGGSSSVLVDTCRARHRNEVMRACEDAGICAILLTHGHFDHCQNAASLSSRFGVPILMHAADEELARDNASLAMKFASPLGAILAAKSKREFKREVIEPFEVDEYLDEGDTLERFGIDARVVTLPGHTLGSIGVCCGEAGMIVGDALIAVPSPRKSLMYADRTLMDDSAAKIADLNPCTIWYGHGEPSGNWLAS